jgi:gluconate 5-dehydrogenase
MTFPLFDLRGRRALVTGSSQGIGLALARGLAEHGAEIVLNGRDPGKLAAAAEALAAAGHTVSVAGFDVTASASVRAGIDAVEADTGPIDILINNAGMQFRTGGQPCAHLPSEPRKHPAARKRIVQMQLIDPAHQHQIGR